MSRSGSGKTLYLFTYTFPYGTGETFLETEIDHLAERFQRIVIVPARRLEAPRPLPPNAAVQDGLARVLEQPTDARELVAILSDPVFRSLFAQRPSILLSPPHLRRLIGQTQASRRSARWIDDHLRHADDDGPICYSYWLTTAAFGLARLRPSRPGMTFVSRAHGLDLYHERHSPPYLPLQGTIVAAADAVFPVSDHGRVHLERQHPQSRTRIEVARLGVYDPGRLSSPADDGTWRILSCSALVPVKRVDHLVRGLAELARRNPDRRLDWTHLGDGPLRSEIEAEASAILPPTVQWRITGHMPNSEVIGYYGANPVDVFVNVSESEGVPVSMMEAQSHGVPIVAPAVGGIPEIVVPGSGSLITSAALPGEVAEAVERLCGDPTAALALRAGARANWQSRYDAARNYSDFVDLLLELSTR